MKKMIMLIAVACWAFSVKAQAPDPDTTAKHFVIMTSIGNLQEVSSGQLAVKMAKMPDVRSFGKMMIDDHTQAQQKLMALAKLKGYNLPPEATGGIVADLKLKNAGDKFDPLYVHAMVTDHRTTIKMFQNYAITGKDPDVKAFAQQTLPILKAHLDEINAIDQKLSAKAK